MSERLHVAQRPCSTCPYSRSTPSGVWAPEEYAKLPTYDRQPDGPGCLATFHCHQQQITGRPTVCRGWLSVHADSPAVRIAVVTGAVDASAIPPEPEPDLYESGAEAFRAGMSDVACPSPQAERAIDRLTRKGRFV